MMHAQKMVRLKTVQYSEYFFNKYVSYFLKKINFKTFLKKIKKTVKKIVISKKFYHIHIRTYN